MQDHKIHVDEENETVSLSLTGFSDKDELKLVSDQLEQILSLFLAGIESFTRRDDLTDEQFEKLMPELLGLDMKRQAYQAFAEEVAREAIALIDDSI